jgi:hypothetical protein
MVRVHDGDVSGKEYKSNGITTYLIKKPGRAGNDAEKGIKEQKSNGKWEKNMIYNCQWGIIH